MWLLGSGPSVLGVQIQVVHVMWVRQRTGVRIQPIAPRPVQPPTWASWTQSASWTTLPHLPPPNNASVSFCYTSPTPCTGQHKLPAQVFYVLVQLAPEKQWTGFMALLQHLKAGTRDLSWLGWWWWWLCCSWMCSNNGWDKIKKLNINQCKWIEGGAFLFLVTRVCVIICVFLGGMGGWEVCAPGGDCSRIMFFNQRSKSCFASHWN